MTTTILGLNIHTTDYKSAAKLILNWSRAGESRSVYAANVHMVMEAYDCHQFREMVNYADLVTPDGMPLVWTLRLKGYRHQTRVYGPTLTEKLLPILAAEGIPVGFLGGSPEVLDRLLQQVREKHPAINIVYAYSPPFRQLGADENQAMIDHINQSGVRVLFVGLGCPKQEVWIHENLGRVRAVMLGVGAAFDFLAGTKRQAPAWVQRLGLEWLFRLTQEPRRLWRRYFYTNPRFVFLIIRELWQEKAVKPREE